MGMFDVPGVDVDGLIAVYQGAQDRRARQIALQREMDREDRKEQRERDFEGAFGRFIDSGALANVYGSPPQRSSNSIVSGENDRTDIGIARSRNPIQFAAGASGGNGLARIFGNGSSDRGLAAIFENRPAKPVGALTSIRREMAAQNGALSPIDTPPARGTLRPVDTNDAMARGVDASQGMGAETGASAAGGPENLLPPEIERMANSPNMDDRNAAFMEMARIDPMRAFKIQSELRDAALDRLKGGQDALRIAASRLASTNDDNSYRAVLSELDQQLMPLGIDISKTVPPTHPGPEGIRKLQMLAMKEADQLAALDREARTEAMIENYDRDNDRQDRNTDSIIADREARTGIARDRAAISGRREDRLAAGGGKPPVKARPTEQTAVNPKTGERMVFRGGKWIPAKGDASGNAGGGFR